MKISNVSAINLGHLPKEERGPELMKIIKRRTGEAHSKALQEAIDAKYTDQQMKDYAASGLLHKYQFKDILFYFVNKEPLIAFTLPKVMRNGDTMTIETQVVPAEAMPTWDEVEHRSNIDGELSGILNRIEAITGGTEITEDQAREAITLIEKAMAMTGENHPPELCFLLQMLRAQLKMGNT